MLLVSSRSLEDTEEQRDRLFKLNEIARSQLKAFLNNKNIRNLEDMNVKQISGGED